MGIKNDTWIIEQAQQGMIENFVDHQVRKNGYQSVISYGVSSAGYDMRLSNTFKVFKKPTDPDYRYDPKKATNQPFYEVTVPQYIVIPPHGFVLGLSVEYFNIPENVMAICYGKSTYARAGIHVLMTPLEPMWKGQVVIEIANLLDVPTRVYAQEGISQVVFYELDDRPVITYADRNGKYQNQTQIVFSTV